MEIVHFTNKVWIEKKGKMINKLLHICGWVYLICNVILAFMEGISVDCLISIVIAILIIVFIKMDLREKGKYIFSECQLVFAKNEIIWKYPQIDLQDGHGEVYLAYHIASEDVNMIQSNKEIQSIRLECVPVLECISKKKSKRIDFRKKKRNCTLILYSEEMEFLKNKFEENLNVLVHEVT